MNDYAQTKANLGIPLTGLDRPFGMSAESDWETEILPTYVHGTKERPNRARKPVVALEDCSKLNAPHTERLQQQVKARWASMTEEEREAARQVRRENGSVVNGKRVKH